MTRNGYILVEVSIAYVILALAVAALVPSFILALKANKKTEKIQTAVQLATELLEEVRLRKWDENSSIPASYLATPSSVGRDGGGESATDKTTYDDIDDFDGWTETGARNPMNVALTDFGAYTRTVAVSYVNSSMAASGSSTDYKKVVVCTRTAGINDVCLTTMLANR